MKVIDLTMPLSSKTPTSEHVQKPGVFGTRWYSPDLSYVPGMSVNWSHSIISVDTHVGTHVDAPFHMMYNKWRLWEVPLDRWVGDAVCLDIPKKECEFVRAEDLEKAEKEAESELKPNDILLIHTGWCDNWDRLDLTTYLHKQPGLHEDGAKWAVKKQIKMVGADLQSIDTMIDIDKAITREKGLDLNYFPTHRVLFENNIPVTEGLVNLKEIAGKRVLFVGMPLKMTDLPDACPVRAVAILL
jgi:kynurenine formamidase